MIDKTAQHRFSSVGRFKGDEAMNSDQATPRVLRISRAHETSLA
jgi:hypothetical protein